METVRVRDIVRVMESYFPPYIAESWDNPGLQIGDMQQEVTKVITALDICQETVEQAVREKAQLILTHHPLFFKPIKCLRSGQQPDDMILQLLRAGISVYSAHTNLDSGTEGLNQYLSEQVGLQHIRALNRRYVEPVLKLEVMVPVDYAEKLRTELGKAGAGAVGKYSQSFFSGKGEMTFFPGAEAHPFIGTIGQLEHNEEIKLETVFWKKQLSAILNVLERVHPYEEPAYNLLPLENCWQSYSLGRIGDLAAPTPLRVWVQQVKQSLGLDYILAAGNPDTIIRKVAVVSGAGTEFMQEATAKGCQVLLTGDLKYHEAQAALHKGLCVVDAGHQGTEKIVADLLQKLLEKEKQQRGWQVDIVKSAVASLIWCS